MLKISVSPEESSENSGSPSTRFSTRFSGEGYFDCARSVKSLLGFVVGPPPKRRPQGAPKVPPQMLPRWPQDRPKIAPRSPARRPNMPPRRRKMHPRCSNTPSAAPRRPQEASTCVQDAPRCIHDVPTRIKATLSSETLHNTEKTFWSKSCNRVKH